jgi:hypothetical protein
VVELRVAWPIAGTFLHACSGRPLVDEAVLELFVRGIALVLGGRALRKAVHSALALEASDATPLHCVIFDPGDAVGVLAVKLQLAN